MSWLPRPFWPLAAALAGLLAVAAAIALAQGMGAGGAQQVRQAFTIATGPTGGTYFPVGEALANVISHPPGVARCESFGRCGPAGLIATARVSEGSIANIRAVEEGRVLSGLAQEDMIAAAAEGRTPFNRRTRLQNVRTIAALYAEAVHVVVRADSGIATLADLRGKRIAIGPDTSGIAPVARALLVAAGVGTRAKLSGEGAEAAARALEAGTLDAFVFVGGVPVPAIADLARRGAIAILPVTGDAAAALVKAMPRFAPVTIPAGTYEGVPPVETVAVRAIWIVAAGADEETVREITAALWHPDNREVLAAGHPVLGRIALADALAGLPVPLHPGAERWYREAGVYRGP